jgi:hypothetical protein
MRAGVVVSSRRSGLGDKAGSEYGAELNISIRDAKIKICVRVSLVVQFCTALYLCQNN